MNINNRLDHFQITANLLNIDNTEFEQLKANQQLSSEDDFKQAISYLIPQHSGHELIRIGGRGDGGYLVPDDMEGIEACFSPGVSNFKNFEDELANRFGIKSFMCDYTSDVSLFRTPLIHNLQFFEKKWLDVVPSEDNLDINQWVLNNVDNHKNSDLLLQIDIEGAEYRNIIHAQKEVLDRFRIIVIEIHALGALIEQQFLQGIFLPFIKKLSDSFVCVHAHPNNCCGISTIHDVDVPNILELTLLRKDRIQPTDKKLTLPHALDDINVPQNVPLHLDGIWLKHADLVASEMVGLRQSVKWFEHSFSNISRHMQLIQLMQNSLSHQACQTFSLITNSLDQKQNIALGKKAFQSSLSPYSTHEGPNGAINGLKTGKFGFHTDFQDNPWWMVDLGNIYEIDAIVVYNRLDAASDRSNTLKVSVSIENLNWTVIYNHTGKLAFGGIQTLNGMPPLLINLNKAKARFVKLECTGRTYLHLDEVEIYGK